MLSFEPDLRFVAKSTLRLYTITLNTIIIFLTISLNLEIIIIERHSQNNLSLLYFGIPLYVIHKIMFLVLNSHRFSIFIFKKRCLFIDVKQV